MIKCVKKKIGKTFKFNCRFSFVQCCVVLVVFFVVLIWSYKNAERNSHIMQGENTITFVSQICHCVREIDVTNRSIPSYVSDEFLWCSMDSYLRGPHQKVIAYTLYGKINNRYYSLLKNISSTIENLYPGWIVRIYYNFDNLRWQERETQRHLCDVYCQFNHVDICSWQTLIERSLNSTSLELFVSGTLLRGLNAKLYRFLALLDPNIHIFISRDADSLILQREVDAVKEWLKSNYTFHIMRDHINHHETIMAGMWETKLHNRRPLLNDLTKDLLLAGQDQNIDTDQQLLDNIFWPYAQYDAMVHDSYLCQYTNLNAKTSPLKVFPFPTKRDGLYFVGSPSFQLISGKCPEACRPPDHLDWEYC